TDTLRSSGVFSWHWQDEVMIKHQAKIIGHPLPLGQPLMSIYWPLSYIRISRPPVVGETVVIADKIPDFSDNKIINLFYYHTEIDKGGLKVLSIFKKSVDKSFHNGSSFNCDINII